MTSATTSMPLFSRERARVFLAASAGAQPAASADAEARRLAAAVGRGDEAAFQQLYDTYHQRLLRLALVLGHGDEPLAQETVQSVFLTAAKKLRHAESEAHLWNWLARVARQQISKNQRRERRDSPVVGVAELPECAEIAEPDSRLEMCLDAALLELEPEERRLIESFYFDRLSQKELGELLGVTPKAVSGRLERAREKLRLAVARNLSRET